VTDPTDSEPTPEIEQHPLVGEVMKKAAVVWITTNGERPVPAWPVWIDGAAHLVTGPGEQPIPPLTDTCAVTARSGSTHARILSWDAAVSVLAPGSDDWQAVAPQLIAKRLNLPGGDDTLARWAAECTLYRLRPAGPVRTGVDLPADRQDAPPPRTPAATRTTVPFTLGRGRARRRQT
jgi:hypothetical protein